ncbi:ABC transporter ATP-binding protein [Acidisoma silvae]|uniref:ABC transporter ATP-binding protein n=1 Tax=Acidisoma silvae TaxID=2802396 RepID=A0A964E0P8_9PROT|nr:ABC transporter ATP-binding protein [Acidisoma silvae]MCB8876948.1 ABC transporter ATP-binding protein [Acidisoma silvae]
MLHETAPLLRLEGLSISRPDGSAVLDGIDLTVPADGVLGILGESGAGKTTLAKVMVGWVSDPLRITGGSVRFRGEDLRSSDVQRKVRPRIGFIGADPGNAFDPTLPVGVQIAEKLLAVAPGTDMAEAKKRVIALLDAVRIPSAARRFAEFPGQYSGGMLQRAVIVDALINEPDLLICDNIIQPLDVTVAAQIVRLLKELRARTNAGIVFITTSVPSVAEIADEVAVLAAGRIVERGLPMAIARSPQHAVTQELVARTPRIWTGEPAPEPSTAEVTPILQVSDITKTYSVKDRSRFFGKQNVQAVRGVSFDVFQGDNFGLVGESGCGKSTLSRLLSWVEEPDSGAILFEGKNIAEMTGRERFAMRRGFQLLLQDPYNCLPPHLPVGRTISSSLTIHGVGRKETAERVRAAMAEVGLSPDDLHRLPIGMSAGQRQRVNIARALVLEPKLLILDETLSALDPVEQGRLLNLFERLQAKHGLTYLFISHDLAMVRRVCTRIAVMYLGKMVEIADTGGVFYDPGHPYTKALLSAVPTLDERPYRTEDVLLDGEPPSPIDLPPGCSFTARCPEAMTTCRMKEPALWSRQPGRLAACHVTAPAP